MPSLPEWGAYLLDHLFELGPVGNDAPISPQEFDTWATRVHGIEWEPWEVRLLYRLSREYYGEMHQATRWNAYPPWPGCIPDFRELAARKEERKMDALFRELS